jgi:hypothetical protein
VGGATGALSLTAGGGDSGVAGALAQLLWGRVLRLLPDPSPAVRARALGCTDALLRGGLVMPMHAVPHLLALAADPGQASKRRAGALLAQLAEREPMFLTARLPEGLEAAFCFREALARRAAAAAGGGGDAGELCGPDAQEGLKELAWRFRGVKNFRQAFLAALLRMLEEGGPDVAAAGVPARQRFAAHALSALPFCGADEPSALVGALNRTISTRGASLEPALKARLRSAPPDGAQPAPAAATDEAAAAISVCTVLLLKRSLRGAYGLSEAALARGAAGDAAAGATKELTCPESREPGSRRLSAHGKPGERRRRDGASVTPWLEKDTSGFIFSQNF